MATAPSNADCQTPATKAQNHASTVHHEDSMLPAASDLDRAVDVADMGISTERLLQENGAKERKALAATLSMVQTVRFERKTVESSTVKWFVVRFEI